GLRRPAGSRARGLHRGDVRRAARPRAVALRKSRHDRTARRALPVADSVAHRAAPARLARPRRWPQDRVPRHPARGRRAVRRVRGSLHLGRLLEAPGDDGGERSGPGAAMTSAAFKGWPVEAVEFFEALEDDNTRAFWHEHKATYDEKVRRPMEQLLEELSGEFGEGHIFRPNRDVRFSRD